MGTKNKISVWVLGAVFAITAFSVHGFTKATPVRQMQPLSEVFAEIDGYQTLQHIPMEDKAVNMLALDDYLFADYRGKDAVVNLYIGYYYSSDKAYAAHSPLVCYPSQGWRIDARPMTDTLTVGPYTIAYEEIVTSHGAAQELVLYWYQARSFTNTKVYRNKISMGYNKLMHNDEQHGFVRVSVPIRNNAREAAKMAATDFIEAFYPMLIGFVGTEPDS